jgi:hypothetical protein
MRAVISNGFFIGGFNYEVQFRCLCSLNTHQRRTSPTTLAIDRLGFISNEL